MKQRIVLALACSAGLAAALPASAQTNVGVSVSVNQPGVYGRIDIGHVPSAPVLLYPQPVVIAPPPPRVVQQPIYLHVPPGHAKDWRKHCRKYNACNQPVYFVQEQWYQTQYVPYREREHDHARGRERDRDDDHGRGNGKGRGNGNGKGHGKGHKD